MFSPQTNHSPLHLTDLPLWNFHEPDNSTPEPDPERPKPARPRLSVDERRLRRKISNRESARRLRARKLKHLSDLRTQVDRLTLEKRESTDLLQLAVCKHELVRRENERLESEAAALQQRLWEVAGILKLRQKLNPLQFAAWTCSDDNDSFGYQVGNGKTISIWNSPWIPDVPGFIPYCCFAADKENLHLVSDLMTACGTQWDEELILQTFRPLDAISGYGLKDKLV
ncbi:basic-leucine zipper transcription factor family protein [Striga asiatica]|uniref:Basic-leucine zipper transcription factor family protein n=1 Tax=Striga asiatica TaxID=4170 RepID=A0A5A7PK02_STRAF|nr:basic-leucine zipper transcription factor family protein [Striga asiatica]